MIRWLILIAMVALLFAAAKYAGASQVHDCSTDDTWRSQHGACIDAAGYHRWEIPG